MVMEQKLSCARHDDGVPRLPPGFRFHPTDEELVVQYLKRKAFSCPLPAAIIPDIDLGKHDPWELLPGGAAGCAGERYFFNLRETKYPKGNRSNRAASSGYWKATGKDKEIVSSSRCGQAVVGMKKVLVFYRGKPPTGSRTDWIMHEYRLAGAGAVPQRKNSTAQTTVVPSCDWVLCRIFKKKRATRTDVEPEGEEGSHGQEEEVLHSNVSAISLIDFMGRRGNLRSSTTGSSESSCVTETSDGSIHGEEASSA